MAHEAQEEGRRQGGILSGLKNALGLSEAHNQLSEEEINHFCLDLPRYKRPRKIIFAPVLRNPTGKIDKPKLRAIYAGDRLVEKQIRS